MLWQRAKYFLKQTCFRQKVFSRGIRVNVTFAPTINGGGNVGEISQVLKQERDAFMQQFEALARQERRLSYA